MTINPTRALQAAHAIDAFVGKLLRDESYLPDGDDGLAEAGVPAILATSIPELVDAWPMHGDRHTGYPVDFWCEHRLADWLGCTDEQASAIIANRWPADMLRELADAAGVAA